MVLQEHTLHLLQGVEDHTDHNDQRGTAEELRELCIDTHQTGKGGEDGHDGEEDGTREGDLAHHVIDVLLSRLTGLDTGDKPIGPLEVVRDLTGIDRHCGIEVGKDDDQEGKDEIVPEA